MYALHSYTYLDKKEIINLLYVSEHLALLTEYADIGYYKHWNVYVPTVKYKTEVELERAELRATFQKHLYIEKVGCLQKHKKLKGFKIYPLEKVKNKWYYLDSAREYSVESFDSEVMAAIALGKYLENLKPV